MNIERKKILITVKTYPTLSKEYGELVCTAGFLEDGSWIRLYPIPFRLLNDNAKFAKWQWIEVDVVKPTKDKRPESYRIHDIETLEVLNRIGTEGSGWNHRREIALRNVRYDMSELIVEAMDTTIGTSLAVLKPKEIIDFYAKPCTPSWDEEKLNIYFNNLRQRSLFDKEEELAARRYLTPAIKIPFHFKYKFVTADGKVRDIMVEDWETGMLFLNCLKDSQSPEIACQKVKEKYLNVFAKQQDIYFFMGTNWQWHQKRSPNPFMIIGVFAPPYNSSEQMPSLFDNL